MHNCNLHDFRFYLLDKDRIVCVCECVEMTEIRVTNTLQVDFVI